MRRDRVFISYRRSDSQASVTALRQSLITTLGESAVFQDVTGIALGDRFPDRLRDELNRAAVVVAVIGDEWLTASDSWGRRRIDDPTDRVHVELAESLSCPDVTVIPLLLDDASLPTQREAEDGALPEPLRDLCVRNAIRVAHSSWDRDSGVVLDRIRDLLGHDLLLPDVTAGRLGFEGGFRPSYEWQRQAFRTRPTR